MPMNASGYFTALALTLAWEGKSHDDLVPGNEITSGMLWPDGKLPQNWRNFAGLLKAGIKGIEAGCGTKASADHDPHRMEDAVLRLHGRETGQ